MPILMPPFCPSCPQISYQSIESSDPAVNVPGPRRTISKLRNETYHVFSNLHPGTTYLFSVRARTAKGFGQAALTEITTNISGEPAQSGLFAVAPESQGSGSPAGWGGGHSEGAYRGPLLRQRCHLGVDIRAQGGELIGIRRLVGGIRGLRSEVSAQGQGPGKLGSERKRRLRLQRRRFEDVGQGGWRPGFSYLVAGLHAVSLSPSPAPSFDYADMPSPLGESENTITVLLRPAQGRGAPVRWEGLCGEAGGQGCREEPSPLTWCPTQASTLVALSPTQVQSGGGHSVILGRWEAYIHSSEGHGSLLVTAMGSLNSVQPGEGTVQVSLWGLPSDTLEK
jgi:hypothetical protein